MLAMLHFSRRGEAQADLLGFYEILRSGWAPQGFIKLFGLLDTLEKSSQGEPILFIFGHPPTPERAAAIRRELTLVTAPTGAATDSAAFQSFKGGWDFCRGRPGNPSPASPHRGNENALGEQSNAIDSAMKYCHHAHPFLGLYRGMGGKPAHD